MRRANVFLQGTDSRSLFDAIALKYDLLNRLLSLGLDRGWRKRTVRSLAPCRPELILDVATGSGDMAIAALALNPVQVTAVDVSEKMLAVAAAKIKKKKAGHKITLQRADAEALPFADQSFDAVTVAFGVRNFANLEKGLGEISRVLKKGGTAVILEFSLPRRFPMRQLQRLYLRKILPRVGGFVSRNRAAYAYLASSVLAFPQRGEFAAILERCGFDKADFRPLSFGICSVYTAEK